MDPSKTPQGTLSQLPGENPLVQAVTGQTTPAQPTAEDTSQQPLPGANTLANPNAPVSGGATMGQRSPVLSNYLTKLGGAATSAMNAGVPPLSALVAGAIHATNPETDSQPSTRQKIAGGIMGGVNAIGASLGDVGNIGKVPEGAGGLYGAAKTLQARSQRQRQARLDLQEVDKNKVMMAEANVRMLHEQKLIHQLDEASINQSVDSGNQTVEKLKTGASPAPVIASGLTSDELNQYLQQNKIDPTKETAYPTGRKVVGQNPDGTPVYRTTYTAMGVPPEVKLDPENPADKKILDDMNKFAPPSQGKWGTTGIQTMTGTQYNWVQQQVSDNRAATMARDQTLIKNKLMEKENVRNLEAVNFGGSDWTNALSNSPNHDPIAARNAILNNPELSAKYPNLDNDLRIMYGSTSKGEPVYDKMLEDYQKKVDMGFTEITDLQKEVDKSHGEDAAGLAANIQTKLDNPNTPAAIKPKLLAMQAQANAAAKSSANYATDLAGRKKQAEAAAEEKANEGDLSDLKDMVLSYQYEPDKLFSRFKGLKAKQEFLADIHRTDPTWSEAEYKARFKTNQDFTPEGKGGLAVQSFNAFAGHVGDANSLIDTLQNTNVRLVNKPLNKIKDELGSDKIGAYKAALEAVTKEYENFLNNQHAAHEIDKEGMAKLISEDTSPAKAQAIMRQFAHTVAVKARALNATYRTTMKKDVPNLLDPDTQQVFKQFGIDPNQITSQNESGLAHARLAAPNQQGSGLKVPQGAASPAPGKSANGTPVWKMNDGSIQDANGTKYNPQTGQPQ